MIRIKEGTVVFSAYSDSVLYNLVLQANIHVFMVKLLNPPPLPRFPTKVHKHLSRKDPRRMI